MKKLRSAASWKKHSAALKRRVASARKRAAKLGINLDGSPIKKNPGKSVRLTNFTGTVQKNANGTVSIVGRAKRKRNPSKTSVRRRVSRALTKYVRGQR